MAGKSPGGEVPREAGAGGGGCSGDPSAGELEGRSSGLAMEEKFLVLRFTDEEDRLRVLHRPWVISGQPLAVEPWRPWFYPSRSAIQTAVVWIRLPSLPVELWEEDIIRDIMETAGELVSMDDCTVHRRRLGFARVAVRINLMKPLRPGVVIEGQGGRQWQRFVYEQLDGVCFDCGFFHGDEGRCPAAESGPPASLRPDNITVAGEAEEGAAANRQVLGPWIAAVRRWLPPETKPESSGPSRGSKLEVPRKKVEDKGKGPAVQGADRAGAPPEVEGWSKPSRIARRRSPTRALVTGAGGVFNLLADDPVLRVPHEEGEPARGGSRGR